MDINIPQEVLQRFFGATCTSLEILRVAQFGISGTKVVLVRNGGSRLYALKYGQSQTPLSKQIQNHKTLAAFIEHRLLKVRDYCEYPEGEAMLMDGIDGPTLHEAVMLAKITEEQGLAVTGSIFSDLQGIWKTTRNDLNDISVLARDPKTRAAKALNTSREVLLRHDIDPSCDQLIINGVKVGSLESLVSLFGRYDYPTFSVLCHSDLNADNILLEGGIDGSLTWYIVDPEWVGPHDWKVSMSQAYGWWSAVAFGLKSKPVLHRLNRDTVELTYEINLPEPCRKIQECCLATARAVANELREQSGWQMQFWLLVSYFLLAQNRFSKMRGREEFVLPLLGEGLKLLCRSDQVEV